MKKSIIISLSALAGVALIGTGFAGWVISQQASTNKNGDITVYTVSTNNMAIKDLRWDDAAEGDQGGHIIFGKPASTPVTTYSWLSATDEVKVESLVRTLTFTVSNEVSTDNTTPKLAISLTVNDSANGSYAKYNQALNGEQLDDYINAKYKVGENALAVDNDYKVQAVEGSTNSFRVTLTVKFAWGDHFKEASESNGKNPYIYYNSHASVETLKEDVTYYNDAKTALEAIDKLKDVNYSIAITADHA